MFVGALVGGGWGQRMLGLFGGSRRVRPRRATRKGLGSVDARVLDAVDHVRKVLLGLRVQLGRLRVCGRGHGLAQTESGAHDGARDGGGVVEAGPCDVGPVLLAVEVVVVGILAVVSLLAGAAGFLERGSGGGGGGRGLVGQDLFGEDLGGERRQRGDAALEVVATAGGAWSVKACDFVVVGGALTASPSACGRAAGRWSGRRPGTCCR